MKNVNYMSICKISQHRNNFFYTLFHLLIHKRNETLKKLCKILKLQGILIYNIPNLK